jgi:YbbR domain-containing protein
MIRYLRPFKNLLLRNAQLKFVSLTLALLLWIALNGEPKSEVGFKVPLEFRNSPENVEVIGDTINSVDVRVSGSSSMVKRIDSSSLTVSLDLSDWSFGERTYSLSEANLTVPFGVSVTKITPSKIRLRFEPTERKAVHIRPRIIGQPAEGYQVVAVSCDPNQTQLEGPASHLASITTVTTDSLDITGRSSRIVARLHVFVEDPLVRLTNQQETSVEVLIAPKGLEVSKDDPSDQNRLLGRQSAASHERLPASSPERY